MTNTTFIYCTAFAKNFWTFEFCKNQRSETFGVRTDPKINRGFKGPKISLNLPKIFPKIRFKTPVENNRYFCPYQKYQKLAIWQMTNSSLYKWSKHKKPFILAPGLARAILSVFLDHFAIYSTNILDLYPTYSNFILDLYTRLIPAL